MKYCPKCKQLYRDEESMCTDCQKQTVPVEDKNTPVFLMSAGDFELQRICAALEDAGIPSGQKRHKKIPSAQAVTGVDYGDADILVPYQAYEKAYDICIGIGAIQEEETKILDEQGQALEEQNRSLDEQLEETSGVKRTTMRVILAVFLLLLITLAVFGTDLLTGFIKSLFG